MHHIYLFNDQENSFNFVFACLMEILQHVPTQAEQCCLIAQNNGKCHVKQGEYMELMELEKAFVHKGLKVELRKEMYA